LIKLLSTHAVRTAVQQD